MRRCFELCFCICRIPFVPSNKRQPLWTMRLLLLRSTTHRACLAYEETCLSIRQLPCSMMGLCHPASSIGGVLVHGRLLKCSSDWVLRIFASIRLFRRGCSARQVCSP